MKRNLLFLLLLIATSLLINCGGETDEPAPDCNTSDLALVLSNNSAASCGSEDGEIQVTASGGAGEYEFTLDGTNFQPGGTFSDLPAGGYTIAVRDANDCTKTLAVEVENQAGIELEAETTDAGCGASQGTLSLTATGGAEPYQYKLNNGSFAETTNFSGLSSGKYAVTVMDANGCSTTTEVTLASGISFSSEVSAIIETNCAISGCHAGTAGIPDFRQFDNIKDNAATIKTLTANGTMPKEGSLTEEEIAAIACWVDDGAKDN